MIVSNTELVRAHKKRLQSHYKDCAIAHIEKICDQHRKLVERVASDGNLNNAFVTSCKESFEKAWAPAGCNFVSTALQGFAAGLATVMPTTSRVEADFSLMTYRRDDFCNNLSDFALEGVMHAKQLRRLQDAVIDLE